MGGSQEKMDIQLAPLMSELQRKFLNSMLGGVIKGVSDFPLGAGFPGYGPDMYSPRPFEYGYEPGSKKRQGGNDGGRDGNGDKHRKGDDDITGGFTPMGGPAPSMMTPGIPAMGGQASPKPLNWFSMLNQQAPPQNQGAMIPQMLTTPFMDPFRYGLTGNYPRRT